MIELRVLGTVDLEREAGEEFSSVLSHPKRIGLLVYLAIASPRGFHRRDTLVGLLWPESTDQRARHSLNQALYILRRTLGPEVLQTRGAEEVKLDGSCVRCDAVSFVELLGEGEHVAALNLYRGELLPGFFIPGCGQFERWVEAERQRLRSLAVRSAWEQVDVEKSRGRINDALHWARRAREWAPYDEPGERKRIELLVEMGDLAGALHTYEAFAGRLADELGTQPSPALRRFVEGLRRTPFSRGPSAHHEERSKPTSPEPSETPRPASEVGENPDRRDARPRRATRRFPGMGVGTAAAAVLLIGAAFLLTGTAPEPEGGKGRVVVLVFENQTGDSTRNAWGRMAADWVARDLARTGLVRVATPATAFRIDNVVRERADAVAPRSRLRAAAEEFGEGTLVWGSYHLQGDSIVFQAHAANAPEGEILRSFAPVMAPANEPLNAFEELARAASVVLSPLLEERLSRWTRYASESVSWDAYREFVAGLEAHTSRSGAALAHYRKAMELDSAWHLPALWALWVAPPAEFDAILNRLSGLELEMNPFDDALLDYHQAWARQDGAQIYRAAARLVELAPDSEFLFKLAFAATWIRRSEEAVQLLLRADPDHGWLRDWHAYWYLLADAHHRLGQHDEELAVLRRARQRFPDAPGYIAREAQALVELDQIDDALLTYEELSLFPVKQVGAFHHFFFAGILRLRGQEKLAHRVGDRALARYGAINIGEVPGASGPTLAIEWARRGESDRARELLDTARVRLSAMGLGDHPVLTTSYGVVAALEGNTEEVQRLAQKLADWNTRATPGWTLNYNRGNAYWGQAAIAAHMDDTEAALRFVKLAAQHGKHPIIPVDLWYEPLWTHPEYRRLIME